MDSPIGALLFVSAAISVFALLSILIMRKGTETHSIAGYVYFFSIAFANYASAMAFYEGLIPLSTILISFPLSTFFLILGIVFIYPKEKTKFRIKAHILSMMTATVAFLQGITTQWYHFKISLLDVLQWNDIRALFVLSLPILVIGIFAVLHFMNEVDNIYLRYSTKQNNEEKSIEANVHNIDLNHSIQTRSNTEVIYKEDEREETRTRANQNQ